MNDVVVVVVNMALAASLLACAAAAPCRRRDTCMQEVLLEMGGVEIEAVGHRSLHEVASLFVDAFWTSTFDDGELQLTGCEREQLTRRTVHDFSQRYGNSWHSDGEPPRLFKTRLLLARASGRAVGCMGVECSIIDPLTSAVFTSAEAEMLFRAELNALTLHPSQQARLEELNELKRSGLVPLVGALFPHYTPALLVTNLAVAPMFRRTGVARTLCACAELGCDEWALPGTVLQVEEGNLPAQALYGRLGYAEVFRRSDLKVPRVQLPSAENAELLAEVQTTVVTLAKQT